jgi:hypothetical protein
MHPVDIDLMTLARILGDLSYSEKTFVTRDEKELPVFQETEVDRLVTVLSGALGSAGENQRVVFTSFNKGGGLLFEKQRKTEGLMFVDGKGHLNIAFSEINKELPNDEKAAASVKQPVINTLEVRVSRTPLVTSHDYIHPQFQEDGKPYPMWISIDLTAMEKCRKNNFSGSSRCPASIHQHPPNPTNREDLRSRLQYLKSLFDEGLISEQEYDESRRKLIDTIR